MRVWQVVLVMSLFGAAGGVFAYLFISGRRRRVQFEDGPKESGVVATAFTGAAAAALAWGLVGTRGAMEITALLPAGQKPFTIEACVAAIGVGMSGSAWLGSHYQAKIFAFAGEQAALGDPDETLASAIASRDPKRIQETMK